MTIPKNLNSSQKKFIEEILNGNKDFETLGKIPIPMTVIQRLLDEKYITKKEADFLRSYRHETVMPTSAVKPEKAEVSPEPKESPVSVPDVAPTKHTPPQRKGKPEGKNKPKNEYRTSSIVLRRKRGRK